jgi:hypothetical protein
VSTQSARIFASPAQLLVFTYVKTNSGSDPEFVFGYWGLTPIFSKALTTGTATAASAMIVSVAEIGRKKKIPIPASEMISDWRKARSASGPSTKASTSAAGE